MADHSRSLFGFDTRGFFYLFGLRQYTALVFNKVWFPPSALSLNFSILDGSNMISKRPAK